MVILLVDDWDGKAEMLLTRATAIHSVVHRGGDRHSIFTECLGGDPPLQRLPVIQQTRQRFENRLVSDRRGAPHPVEINLGVFVEEAGEIFQFFLGRVRAKRLQDGPHVIEHFFVVGIPSHFTDDYVTSCLGCLAW
jgi:hypothetical protein